SRDWSSDVCSSDLSVARPSNQEKSQPSVGTAAPSATSSSKERPRPAPADPLATEPSLTVHQIFTPAAASGRDSLPTRRQERSPPTRPPVPVPCSSGATSCATN